uniref:Uncharacterized protein n=1 Tax=Lutzomyia longipalpis TaxID=7200 RepID=A0A1B0EUH4_LUTLO
MRVVLGQRGLIYLCHHPLYGITHDLEASKHTFVSFFTHYLQPFTHLPTKSYH